LLKDWRELIGVKVLSELFVKKRYMIGRKPGFTFSFLSPYPHELFSMAGRGGGRGNQF